MIIQIPKTRQITFAQIEFSRVRRNSETYRIEQNTPEGIKRYAEDSITKWKHFKCNMTSTSCENGASC